VVEKVPGAADVRAERVSGLPYLPVGVRRGAIACHGLDAQDVLHTVEAIGGKVVGQAVEGNRRFALQVRFDATQRGTVEAIQNLKVGDKEGHFIPLGQLAEVWEEEGPAQISRENVQRRISVEVNVRGRDLAGFVAEARRTVAGKVKIPEGYTLEWGGKFEQLESASRRLAVTIPIAMLLIFVLLYFNFHAAQPAVLIFLNVPLAATGGILALWSRGMPFSISAGVGFIALFGIAVLNGIVLLTYITQLRKEGATDERRHQNRPQSRLGAERWPTFRRASHRHRGEDGDVRRNMGRHRANCGAARNTDVVARCADCPDCNQRLADRCRILCPPPSQRAEHDLLPCQPLQQTVLSDAQARSLNSGNVLRRFQPRRSRRDRLPDLQAPHARRFDDHAQFVLGRHLDLSGTSLDKSLAAPILRQPFGKSVGNPVSQR
jgi:hypothetical protein